MTVQSTDIDPMDLIDTMNMDWLMAKKRFHHHFKIETDILNEPRGKKKSAQVELAAEKLENLKFSIILIVS